MSLAEEIFSLVDKEIEKAVYNKNCEKYLWRIYSD
jgi:hypothetical protein